MQTGTLLSAIQKQDADRRYVVAACTPLRKVPALLASQDVRYALVENSDGVIDGVIDVRRVRELLDVDNPVERGRWEELPVGSLAEALSHGHRDDDRTRRSVREGELHSVSDDQGVVALVGGGETYVNWNRISGAITRNHVDPVTLLPVRLSFNRRIREEVERAARSGQALAVLLIDLDRFKDVNDRYGHRTGDIVLRTVASSLRDGIRSYDYVARFGGDEFAVLCSGCKPEEIRLPLARLRKSLTDRQATSPEAARVTLSIGVAVMRSVDGACSPEVLVEQADICLYRAKRGGRETAYIVELDPFGIAVSAPIEVK